MRACLKHVRTGVELLPSMCSPRLSPQHYKSKTHRSASNGQAQEVATTLWVGSVRAEEPQRNKLKKEWQSQVPAPHLIVAVYIPLLSPHFPRLFCYSLLLRIEDRFRGHPNRQLTCLFSSFYMIMSTASSWFISKTYRNKCFVVYLKNNTENIAVIFGE